MCSSTTAERQSLASRDRTCCLRRCLPARPLRFYGFRGSIAHPIQSLCTLRTRRRRRPRNTRYRAPATAYPDRSLTGRTTPALPGAQAIHSFFTRQDGLLRFARNDGVGDGLLRCARNDGLSSAQDGLSQRVARMRGGDEVVCGFFVIASAAKQSILSYCGKMDCFASLAMTAPGRRVEMPVAQLSYRPVICLQRYRRLIRVCLFLDGR